MPVNLTSPVAAQLLPVAGVSLGIAEAGIKRAERKDLLVMLLSEGARVAGVFTTNRSAPPRGLSPKSIWLTPTAYEPCW